MKARLADKYYPWPTNPLITSIRQETGVIISQIAAARSRESGVQLSAFDLMIQVMIVACSYPPARIWLGRTDAVVATSFFVAKGAVREANEIFEDAVSTGEVRINMPLIQQIAEEQASHLTALTLQQARQIDMDAFAFSGSGSFPAGATIKSLRLERQAETSVAKASEKISGQTIIFRRLDQGLSEAIATSKHYLHVARDDELAAYGAFVEGAAIPFAWVSYSLVD